MEQLYYPLKEMFYEKNLIYSFSSNERLNILSKHGINIVNESTNIDRWLNIKSLVNKDILTEKLNIEGLSIDKFNFSIKELSCKEESILYNELKKCEWYNLFCDIINHFKNKDNMTNMIKIAPSNSLYIIRPFLYYFEKKLSESIAKLKNITISEKVKLTILDLVANKIFNFFSKILVIELDIKKGNNELIGNNSDEKFEYFISNYYEKYDDLLNLFYKYPVCTRLAVTKLQYLINFFNESFNRLDKNLKEIKKNLHLNENINNIINIKCSEGDSHQKSKSVIIYEFENEDKIVYKPKNLKVVEAYNEFIEWVNLNSGLLDIKKNLGLYYDNYSFEKYIEYKECESISQIENYYKRFGQIIALSYILCANDFHLENLIANGEYPILIDLETIIQGINPIKSDNGITTNVKMDLQMNSVISSCLLPVIGFNDNIVNKGIDISALNGKEQKLPFKVLAPTNINTDNFRYEYIDYIRPGANNIPKYSGRYIEFFNYTDTILNGFDDMMKFFLNEKNNLLNKRSKLEIFKDLLVRNVIKSTNKYASLLGFSSHPNYMIDMLKREKLLENMWAYPYINKEVVKYENKDMMFDDIPIFFSYTNSKDLISSDNNTIKNYFTKNGYECMIERLSSLDNSKYLKQRSIMMVSLGKYENIINELKGTRNYVNTVCEDIDILTEAKYIGDYLINNAIYSDSNQYITWEDISINSNGTWQASAMTECLYNGIAGIAYFLYELFYISKDKKYYNAYKKAMNTAIKDSKFTNAISAYNGQVSLMFPILNELKKSNKSDFIYFIDDTIKYIENNLDLITEYDWLSGCSGIIALILNAYECINNPEYIKLANILGEKIITELEFEKIKLVGLGHGCTGISMALIRLYKYIKNKDYLSLALKLLDHERNLMNSHNYCEEAKWCKGSTGMGIGRLDILNYYQDQTLLDEINLCIENISSSMKKGDCLCHGNMGDIELLNSYFEKNADENIKSMINTKLIDLISMKNKLGKFSIRNIPQFMSFDLFTGMSGIGYELLRLYNPESISNVLTLNLK